MPHATSSCYLYVRVRLEGPLFEIGLKGCHKESHSFLWGYACLETYPFGVRPNAISISEVGPVDHIRRGGFGMVME